MATFDKYNQFTIPKVEFAGILPETKTVTFEAPDNNILARSLQLNEQREISANTAQASFEKAIQQMASNIGPDNASKEWLSNFANAKRQEIQDYINRGDYHNARLLATKAADEILNDPEYLNRKSHWESYKEQRDAILKRNDISEIRKKRWLDSNPYSYDGAVSGEWNPSYNQTLGGRTFSYVAPDMNWDEFFKRGLALARPEVSTESSSSRHTRGSSNTASDGTSRGSTSMSGSSSSLTITDLDPEKIKKSVLTLLQDADIREQIYQDFDDNVYRAQDLDNQIAALADNDPYKKVLQDRRKQYDWMYDQGGALISFDDYVSKHFNDWYQTASQHDVQHATSSESGRTSEVNNKTSDSGLGLNGLLGGVNGASANSGTWRMSNGVTVTYTYLGNDNYLIEGPENNRQLCSGSQLRSLYNNGTIK